MVDGTVTFVLGEDLTVVGGAPLLTRIPHALHNLLLILLVDLVHVDHLRGSLTDVGAHLSLRPSTTLVVCSLNESR